MPSLILSDGTIFEGESFGAPVDAEGEVVFNTGMVGYPESLTDPSYRGQILVFTYPLIGNYGVPSEEKNEYGFSKNFESEEIHVRGVIVSQVSEFYSHHKAVSSLHHWLEKHRIPGLTGVDTRTLTKKLREHGVMLGRIKQSNVSSLDTSSASCVIPSVPSEARDVSRDAQEALDTRDDTNIPDPNLQNLVADVSCKEVITYEPIPRPPMSLSPIVLAYDCGMKRNILRSFLKRGVTVVRVPWDFDLDSFGGHFDAVFISNGPGDPKMCEATIENIKKALRKSIPTFGICLGCQLLALAIGGDTYKLKFGHRSANQPCIEHDEKGAKTERCIITSQNHGYAVSPDRLPKGWHVWFTNANDGTVEGIRHESGRFLAVQFHPESTPGPEDANTLFDQFLSLLPK